MTLSASNIPFKGVFWFYVHIFAEQMCEDRLSHLSQDATTTKMFQNTAKEKAAYILQHINPGVSLHFIHSNVQVDWLINLTPFSTGRANSAGWLAHRNS